MNLRFYCFVIILGFCIPHCKSKAPLKDVLSGHCFWDIFENDQPYLLNSCYSFQSNGECKFFYYNFYDKKRTDSVYRFSDDDVLVANKWSVYDDSINIRGSKYRIVSYSIDSVVLSSASGLLRLKKNCLTRSNRLSSKMTSIMQRPWVPENVNWKEGSFETFYFYRDSFFVKIASTQSLMDKDSISFMSEPGFILSSGKFKVADSENRLALRYRLLYRTFKISGEPLPGDYITEVMALSKRGDSIVLEMKDVVFVENRKFTVQSLAKLKDVIDKFLPTLSQ